MYSSFFTNVLVDTGNDHTDGLNDGTLEINDNSGKTLKAAYTTKSAGR